MFNRSPSDSTTSASSLLLDDEIDISANPFEFQVTDPAILDLNSQVSSRAQSLFNEVVDDNPRKARDFGAPTALPAMLLKVVNNLGVADETRTLFAPIMVCL